MFLRLAQAPEIENLRNYPQATVEKLRRLLVQGAPAQPDPRRADFYEVQNCSQVFYIHISPVNGKVLLLGTWLQEDEPTSARAAHDAA